MITKEKEKEIVKYLEDQIVEYENLMMHLERQLESEAYGYCRGAINSMKYIRGMIKGKPDVSQITN